MELLTKIPETFIGYPKRRIKLDVRLRRILGDPIQLKILKVLLVKSLTLQEIASETGMILGTIIYHIKLMQDYGIPIKLLKTTGYTLDADKLKKQINKAFKDKFTVEDIGDFFDVLSKTKGITVPLLPR